MKVGDLAEDFELPDEKGVTRSLSGLLADGPVVLFFYPAAMTPGCTAEACHFRDISAELQALGAQPVGISGDSVERQADFATRHRLGYTLLADTEGDVRARFRVGRGWFGLSPTQRTTFVIDTDQRILAIVKDEVWMDAHADKAIEALRKRQNH